MSRTPQEISKLFATDYLVFLDAGAPRKTGEAAPLARRRDCPSKISRWTGRFC